MNFLIIYLEQTETNQSIITKSKQKTNQTIKINSKPKRNKWKKKSHPSNLNSSLSSMEKKIKKKK